MRLPHRPTPPRSSGPPTRNDRPAPHVTPTTGLDSAPGTRSVPLEPPGGRACSPVSRREPGPRCPAVSHSLEAAATMPCTWSWRLSRYEALGALGLVPLARVCTVARACPRHACGNGAPGPRRPCGHSGHRCGGGGEDLIAAPGVGTREPGHRIQCLARKVKSRAPPVVTLNSQRVLLTHRTRTRLTAEVRSPLYLGISHEPQHAAPSPGRDLLPPRLLQNLIARLIAWGQKCAAKPRHLLSFHSPGAERWLRRAWRGLGEAAVHGRRPLRTDASPDRCQPGRTPAPPPAGWAASVLWAALSLRLAL